jgi:hypothetical protein
MVNNVNHSTIMFFIPFAEAFSATLNLPILDAGIRNLLTINT